MQMSRTGSVLSEMLLGAVMLVAVGATAFATPVSSYHGALELSGRAFPPKQGWQAPVRRVERGGMADALRLRGGGEVIDLSGDGGVMKEILVEGVGEETPEKNDDVCVHYVGTLEADGSKFDSSRDREAPFTFKLGQGKVIKGWDTGVATMKKGEKAVLTIRSDYGYGAEGSGDKIPGNASLVFEVELLRWNEKEVTPDGQVFLRPGEKKGSGWRHPDRGDEVLVRWRARVVGGELFEEEPEPILVQLGGPTGRLPAGVERAVCKEMKKGAAATITCGPKYAFGAQGLPPKVPPDAHVEYEVELLDWNAIHDVHKDGGLIVKCLGQLDSYGPLCDDGARVVVMLEGSVVGGAVFCGPEERSLTVGDGVLCEGLERGLEKIKKGQRALITLAPKYGFGEEGDAEQGVPPGATVQYVVHVQEVTPTYQLQLPDKLLAADTRKALGNKEFKAGNYEAALAKYQRAFKLVQYEQGEGEEGERVKEMKGSCHLNTATVYDKMKRLDDCLTEANKALDLQPNSIKALFRRGKTLGLLGKLEEGTADLQRVLTLDPDNRAAKQQLHAIKTLQKAQDDKDRKVFSKMFAPRPAPKPPASSKAPAPPTPAAEAEAEGEEREGEGGEEVVTLGEDTKLT